MAARFSCLRRLRLRRMGPAPRVSLGLCSIMLAALLALDLLFGVLPDHSELDRKLRERTSELVAMKAAGALGSASENASKRAPACVDMCKPSAMRASDPNSAPPMISATIMIVQSAITAQVRRSALSWSGPRKTWLCGTKRSIVSAVMAGSLF